MSITLFSNNTADALASQASIGATSLVLTESSGFPVPGTNEVFYVTLTDGADPESTEVVEVTNNSTGTNTLTCASLAATWPAGTAVEMRIPTEVLDYLVQSDPGGSPRGTNAVNIQPARITDTNVASGTAAVAVGNNTKASGNSAVSIGTSAIADIANAVAVGPYADAGGTGAVAVGYSSDASAAYAVAIGYDVTASVANSIVLGGYQSSATANSAIVLGNQDGNVVYGFVIGATPLLRNYHGSYTSNHFGHYGGSKAVVMSESVDLTQTAADDIVTFSVPSGAMFYPDEVGVIITAASGVSAAPQISFGWTGSSTGLLAQTAMAGDVTGERDRWQTLLVDSGRTSITFSIKVTGSATGTYTGRAYVSGLFVEDDT